MRNATISEMLKLLKAKLPEVNEHFILTMLFNKLSQISTNMRTTSHFPDGGRIPTNYYAFCLATSGYSKGKINNILEDELTHKFKNRFMTQFSATQIDTKLDMLAEAMSVEQSIEKAEAFNEIIKRWNKLPKHLYSFSDATIEGFKAKREKLSMVEFGATNFEVDEIALKFDQISDIFSVLLEAYDNGKAKQKLIKVDSNGDAGKVPSNCLMFGTPSRLLNGSKQEKQFIDLLSQGFGRRSFYCLVDEEVGGSKLNAKERLAMMKNRELSDDMKFMAEHLSDLATRQYFGIDVDIPDDVAEKLLEYQEDCEKRARELKSHQEIEKAELSHRYWKVTKLLGTLVYIDKRDRATIDDLMDAIEFSERSGDDFNRIINRPPNYVRLYNFIVDSKRRMTQTEIIEELYFYANSSKAMRDEMLRLAQSYAYTQGSIVRTTYSDGIEFIEGQETEKNDMTKIILSASLDITESYMPKLKSWNDLIPLMRSGMNFCNHHFKDNYRRADNAIQGFNMIVLDVDDTTPLPMALAVLEDYEYIIGTTKSHQKKKYTNSGTEIPACDRYRVLIPLDRTIKLNEEDFKGFMENIFEWIPIACDKGAKDCSRKWATYENAEVFVNNGISINPLDFIPQTTKQIARSEKMKELGDLSSLEKWFALNASVGDRNNKMLRYALVLKDGGMQYDEVCDAVVALNSKLHDGLPEQELIQTVFKTLRRKFSEEA